LGIARTAEVTPGCALAMSVIPKVENTDPHRFPVSSRST
jgi:hypothetical protein